MLEDLSNPVLKVGMVCPSVEVLRKAIIEYSLKNMVQIKMPRNDKTRIGAHYAKGCPWRLYASHDSRAKGFMVKTYQGEHNCQKEWVLKRFTSKWLVDKYIEVYRSDDKLSLSTISKQQLIIIPNIVLVTPFSTFQNSNLLQVLHIIFFL